MIETGYRILDIAARTKSLSKAAEELHLSPSAVSRSLAKLEKELGMQLFVRSSEGVMLTESARSILPFIRMSLHAELRMEEELGRISNEQKGIVRVGTFSSVGCTWLPDIVRIMKEEHPQVELKIRQGWYYDLEDLLENGDLDVIFASIPIKSNLPTYPLMRDRLLCIAPRSFEPRNPGFVTIEELRDLPFILPSKVADFDAKTFLENNHLQVENPHEVSDDGVIAAMVEGGMGVSIMPELVLERVKADIGVYPVETAPMRTIGLATQRAEFVTGAARSFVRVARGYILGRYPEELPYFR